MARRVGSPPELGIAKCPTGIQGLDEITFGGLPRGRPTLVCGAAGCGKTLFGMEFLVRGATQFDEAGVCLSFEETVEELANNVASLGFDVEALIKKKKLLIDHVFVERSQIEEAGEYDLEALFVRLGHAVDSIGARRVVLDSVETLFAGLSNEAVLRSELRRLFRWLKQKKLTAVVTGERGDRSLTRHGLEEYISDCVLLLDHRVAENVFTRRLRVVKYRGSTHGTNEYPFLITEDGISVLPVTSMGLEYIASHERISTGVPSLDAMLGGKGFYRGSSILISGTAGTGKTSLAAQFLDAACARGEKCVYFSYEEAPSQLVRNMRSIGVDLGRWVDKGLLRFDSSRPTTHGLETHLVRLNRVLTETNPRVVAVDPITALLHSGSRMETSSTLLRIVDSLKQRRITALFTTLSHPGATETTNVDISSMVDAWLQLRDIESSGERNRGLYILKARGMAHSNQIREFHITGKGLVLREPYLGPAGMLTGSARVSQEAREATEAVLAQQETQRQQLALESKRKALQAQIAALQVDLETVAAESKQVSAQESARERIVEQDRAGIRKSRALNVRGRNDNKRGGRR